LLLGQIVFELLYAAVPKGRKHRLFLIFCSVKNLQGSIPVYTSWGELSTGDFWLK